MSEEPAVRPRPRMSRRRWVAAVAILAGAVAILTVVGAVVSPVAHPTVPGEAKPASVVRIRAGSVLICFDRGMEKKGQTGVLLGIKVQNYGDDAARLDKLKIMESDGIRLVDSSLLPTFSGYAVDGYPSVSMPATRWASRQLIGTSAATLDGGETKQMFIALEPTNVHKNSRMKDLALTYAVLGQKYSFSTEGVVLDLLAKPGACNER